VCLKCLKVLILSRYAKFKIHFERYALVIYSHKIPRTCYNPHSSQSKSTNAHTHTHTQHKLATKLCCCCVHAKKPSRLNECCSTLQKSTHPSNTHASMYELVCMCVSGIAKAPQTENGEKVLLSFQHSK